MENIFSDELIKFIQMNLNENEKITESLHQGIHYTVQLEEKPKDEDYLEAKIKFLSLLDEYKLKPDKTLKNKIKFFKNIRFFNGDDKKTYEKYCNMLDILILHEGIEKNLEEF